MRRHRDRIYIVLFLAICILPGAGMFFPAQEEVGANQVLASKPQLIREEKWNPDFLKETDKYVSDHFAFRQQFITMNDRLLAEVFHVSGNDKVVVGKKGWLFFNETVKDFMNQPTMSQADCRKTAKTLALLQEHFLDQGSHFLFTIAPNKNSLYPQYMPGYLRPLRGENNREMLEKEMASCGIHYADLYQMFIQEERVLYHRLDSHWNNEGAALACEFLLRRLETEPAEYVDSPTRPARNFSADLYEMLFPKGREKDWNVIYDYDFKYGYEGQVKDTEDIEIRTVCPGRTGSLAMYRDSFGNALLPFAAESFGKAYFSRQFPWDTQAVDENPPDAVVIEITERNLDQIADTAPVMEAPERQMTGQKGKASFAVQAALWSDKLVKINGYVKAAPDSDSEFYITLGNRQYEAFPIDEWKQGAEGSGFTLYVPAEVYEQGEVKSSVIYKEQGNYWETGTEKINLKEQMQ